MTFDAWWDIAPDIPYIQGNNWVKWAVSVFNWATFECLNEKKRVGIASEAEILVLTGKIQDALEKWDIEIARGIYFELKRWIIEGFLSWTLRNFDITTLEDIWVLYAEVFWTLEDRHTFDLSIDKVWCHHTNGINMINVWRLETIESSLTDEEFCRHADKIIF